MIHVDDAMEPSLKIFSSVVPGTSWHIQYILKLRYGTYRQVKFVTRRHFQLSISLNSALILSQPHKECIY